MPPLRNEPMRLCVAREALKACGGQDGSDLHRDENSCEN